MSPLFLTHARPLAAAILVGLTCTLLLLRWCFRRRCCVVAVVVDVVYFLVRVCVRCRTGLSSLRFSASNTFFYFPRLSKL